MHLLAIREGCPASLPVGKPIQRFARFSQDRPYLQRNSS